MAKKKIAVSEKRSLLHPSDNSGILLLLIIGAGAFLRFWHLNWGLPELFEEATPLLRAWKLWNWEGSGLELNPHFFNYPALTFYLLFALQGLQYFIGHIIGTYSSLQIFASGFSSVVIPARIVMGLFDVGTIYLTYRFAKEHADQTIALIAAAFVALNSLLIKQAHYITVDTPLTFFVMLSLLFIYRISTQPSPRWYILSGICVGLAAATKYTGAFLLLILLAMHMLQSKSISSAIRSLTRPLLLKSIGLATLVFLLVNPYIMLSLGEFLRDFSFEQSHMAEGHLGIDSSRTTLGYYVLEVLTAGIGWVMFLVLVGTIAVWMYRNDRHHLLMMMFPAIYIAIISAWEMRAERYLLPAFPPLLIMCALGARELVVFSRAAIKRAPANIQHRISTVTAVLVGIVLIAEPLNADYRFAHSITLPDTRVIAKEWIEQHFPKGAAIATGPFGIQLRGQSYHLLNIPFLAINPERVAAFYDTRWYEDLDLLIASDYDYVRYAADPQKYQEFLPYYDSLRTHWKQALEVKPTDAQQGSAIWLYTPRDSLNHPLFDPSLFAKFEGTEESSRVSLFLNDLSAILLEKGKWEKSEQLLKEILSVEVSNFKARNMLARALFGLGKYEQALIQLKKSMETNPHQADVVAFAGENLLRLGHEQEAEGAFLRAIQLDNSLEAAYLDLITFYSNRGDKPKLIDILTRYEAILPAGSERADAIEERINQLKIGS